MEAAAKESEAESLSEEPKSEVLSGEDEDDAPNQEEPPALEKDEL